MKEKKNYAVFKVTAKSSPRTALKEKKLQAVRDAVRDEHGYHPLCRCLGKTISDRRDDPQLLAYLGMCRREEAYEESRCLDHTYVTRFYIHECYQDGWLKPNGRELREAGLQS